MSWFHWKKRVATEFVRSQTTGLFMCGAQCWDAIRNTHHNRPTLPSWRLPCYRHGVISHRNSLIRQPHHFERYFGRVLLQLVDILTQFKYRDGSWNSSLKRWNCWRKSCAVWFVITEYSGRATACSLEKVNFKFKTVVSIEPHELF